jgi:hypothetical protein
VPALEGEAEICFLKPPLWRDLACYQANISVKAPVLPSGRSMRDQYAGDISDVLKFAFLRALAVDRTLGVAWYCIPGHDGGPDGRHLEWHNEPAWRLLDEKLHTGLTQLPERSIAALEQAAIWPTGTLFHREPMPPKAGRSAWGAGKRSLLDGADLVFLDPDNGIGKETPKHATFPEVRLLRKPGRGIVFISFPHKGLPHETQWRQLHERLAAETHAENIVTLRISVMVLTADGHYVPRIRWFTLIDADTVLTDRVEAFTEILRSIPGVKAELQKTRGFIPLVTERPFTEGVAAITE